MWVHVVRFASLPEHPRPTVQFELFALVVDPVTNALDNA